MDKKNVKLDKFFLKKSQVSGRLSHGNGIKMQKNSKKHEQQIKNIVKTQISEAIEIIR